MSDRKQEVANLLQKAVHARSSDDLEAIDEEFFKLVQLFPTDPAVLFNYNEFRITYISKLPKTRPQVILGGPFNINYPNLHIYPLYELADIICLTPVNNPYPYRSAIQCLPHTLFFDVLKLLPKGFEPDFFWDNQIEQMHYIPAGIQMAPFPIVASVCHTYLHKSIEHVCELFDFVIANSKSHAQLLSKKFPGKILDFPFGLNWASFNYFLNPSWDKTIDVCVTFQESSSAVFLDKRNKVLELARKFKEKYGNRFSIKFFEPLSKEEYLNVLKKSRITLNVVGVHGPYNYRTVEAMCAGSMVFQYEWDDPFFDNHFSERFIDGRHGASFDFNNFEEKLLYYLENPNETEKIAKEAYAFLCENYSYKKLFQSLIKTVQTTSVKIPRDLIDKAPYHDVDMVYYNQNNIMVHSMVYSSIDENKALGWIRSNNLLVLTGTMQENEFARLILLALSSKELALSKTGDIWALCSCYYEEALKSIPQEHAWIVYWNYLLLSIEHEKVNEDSVKKVLSFVEAATPQPFNELKIIFKYYIKHPLYPDYHLKKDAYFKLNMDLMRDIDDPIKRAGHYRQYALTAIKYIMTKICSLK